MTKAQARISPPRASRRAAARQPRLRALGLTLTALLLTAAAVWGQGLTAGPPPAPAMAPSPPGAAPPASASALTTPPAPQRAQQQPQRAPSTQPPTTPRSPTPQAPTLPAGAPITVDESIDVRVVNVEAVVTDRGGRVVHGLTAGDFQLLVDGREVPIDYFTEVRGAQAVAPPPQPGGGEAGAARPAPREASSQLEPGAAVARNYLVFVDDGFAVGARRDAALARLRDGLRTLAPEDRMAVVAFGGGRPEMLSGWSGDKAALAAALDRAVKRAAHGNRMLAQQRSMANDEELARYAGEPDQVAQMLEALRMRVSPEVLTQLARSSEAAAATLRAFELPAGRRILLLLSGGWSVATDRKLYAPLVEAANQLGYTLFPIDVATEEIASLRLFDDLARATGGRVLSAGGRAALAEAAEETDSYYLLGFSPGWRADDHPHPLQVRVRRADLETRSRTSYSDMSRQSTASLKAQSVLLFGAERGPSGPDAAQLKVEGGSPRRLGRDEMELPVTLLLPIASLSFTGRGADVAAEVLLAVAALDAEGRRTELPEVMLHFRLASLPAAARTLRFRTSVKLRRVEQRLVFATVDARTGATLTAELAVHPGGPL